MRQRAEKSYDRVVPLTVAVKPQGWLEQRGGGGGDAATATATAEATAITQRMKALLVVMVVALEDLEGGEWGN